MLPHHYHGMRFQDLELPCKFSCSDKKSNVKFETPAHRRSGIAAINLQAGCYFGEVRRRFAVESTLVSTPAHRIRDRIFLHYPTYMAHISTFDGIMVRI